MTRYQYVCFNCHAHYPASEIEEHFHYLCPACGRAEKNQPLKGVLLIEYDYRRLRQHYTRANLLEMPPGQFWRYSHLWPLAEKKEGDNSPFHGIRREELLAVNLPANSLHPQLINKQQTLILDETKNITYSYKDRASILVALKARQMGIQEIAAASTGNAGSSMAGICARLGLTARVWVPDSIPETKLMQMLAYGAQVHLVKGDYDLAFDLCLEISEKEQWYNRNTAYNPLTIEGKKSAAYDIFLGMKGSLPRDIFVPVGDGVIIGGIYKGFRELLELGVIKSLPRLIAVQSSGSDALVRYLATGRFEYRPAETVADSISAGAPRNLYHAAHAVRESGGFAVAVEDGDIVAAQKRAGEEMGLLVEPAAAATLAGYLKVREKLDLSPGQKPLLLFTGSGLKDLDSLKRLHRLPGALEADIWRERFERSKA